jgi:hypothetical protein
MVCTCARGVLPSSRRAPAVLCDHRTIELRDAMRCEQQIKKPRKGEITSKDPSKARTHQQRPCSEKSPDHQEFEVKKQDCQQGKLRARQGVADDSRVVTLRGNGMNVKVMDEDFKHQHASQQSTHQHHLLLDGGCDPSASGTRNKAVEGDGRSGDVQGWVQHIPAAMRWQSHPELSE